MPMTANTRLEILRRLIADCFKAVFIQYFYLTLVVLGMLLLIASTFIRAEPFGHDWHGTAKAIGETILLAGVVTTFMRFFASLDIVGEKIEGWLSSEAYLQKLSSRLSLAVYEPQRATDLGDLRTLWRQISLAMTRHAFPKIAEQVYGRALEQMVNASADYYYDSFSRTTEIRLTAKDDVAEVEHHIRITVIGNQHDQFVTFRTRLLIDRMDDFEPEILYCHIGGVAQSIEMQNAPDDRPGFRQYLIEAKLDAGEPVEVAYAYKMRQSLRADPFLLWTTTRYIRTARHELNFPKASVQCTYQDTSFAPLLTADPACRPGHLVYVLRPGELIFPTSAFMFMIRKVESSHA
jgi:hypothetical protein